MSKTLTDDQIRAAAEAAGLEPAALKAIDEVESRGAGFLADGQPKILLRGTSSGSNSWPGAWTRPPSPRGMRTFFIRNRTIPNTWAARPNTIGSRRRPA